MKKTTTKPSVSERSTKQEILEAYQSAVQQLEQGPVTPGTVAQLELANTQVSNGLDEVVDGVSQTLTDAISQITIKLQATTKVLAELQQAAEAQKKRLQFERDEAKKIHEREMEEYTYSFNVQKTRQAAELIEQRKKVELEIQARREELVAQKQELTELRKQVAEFEAKQAQAIKNAVQLATQTLTQEHKHETALTTAQAATKVELLEQEVKSLSSLVNDQKKEIERLNKLVADANTQVTRIAERAVSRGENPLTTQNKAE